MNPSKGLANTAGGNDDEIIMMSFVKIFKANGNCKDGEDEDITASHGERMLEMVTLPYLGCALNC